jgi:glutamate-1-semialdehyde 2,1-aminomutase
MTSNIPMYNLDELKRSRGVALYKRAKALIPGGTQLLSKRPEMFAPDVWPAYYAKAKGCHVWDLDGRQFLDMSIMAVGACILGYADDEVDDAVVAALRNGSNSSLNCPEEIELAEALLELHPWFHMVRYARSGGEAMGMAVRIARAYKHRDLVLFSGYHGWNDWYLAANLADSAGLDGQLMPGLEPNGVPRSLAGTAMPFDANNIESLREKVRGNEKQIAAIVIEPARGEDAPAGYLKALRELATEIGAVLIFDEITSGFRMCAGGIHRNYGIQPDMAVFAKSMANGYAMSAVLGIETVMQAAQTTFISSTNWTDRIGPTAALATLKKYQRLKVETKLISTGNRVKDIWQSAANAHGLKVKISGLPTLASCTFESENARALNTRFTVEMLQRGILGFRQFKPSWAHDDDAIDQYSRAVDEVFALLAADPTGTGLDTPLHHAGFQRLTKE